MHKEMYADTGRLKVEVRSLNGRVERLERLVSERTADVRRLENELWEMGRWPYRVLLGLVLLGMVAMLAKSFGISPFYAVGGALLASALIWTLTEVFLDRYR